MDINEKNIIATINSQGQLIDENCGCIIENNSDSYSDIVHETGNIFESVGENGQLNTYKKHALVKDDKASYVIYAKVIDVNKTDGIPAVFVAIDKNTRHADIVEDSKEIERIMTLLKNQTTCGDCCGHNACGCE